jgi:histidinol-phosphate aminotransferase
MRMQVVPDIAWIEPGFAIGSRPYVLERPAIAASGVEAIVALHAPAPDEASAWRRLGVDFDVVPTPDWVAIPRACFEAAVETILRRRAAGQTVLLHCLAGVNRAPTVAAAVLCQRDGLSVGDALARVRAARPVAAPTPEQVASLRAYVRRPPDDVAS